MRNYFRDKRIEIVAVFLLGLYIGGMTGPSGIYIAHGLHHLVTHTLYQHFYHEYAHWRGLHHHHARQHGHTHSKLIDFALHQLDKNKDHGHGKKTPASTPLFRYNFHLQGQCISLSDRTIKIKSFHNVNFSCPGLTDKEPNLPPPKQIL